jgi:hypothetical protein
MEGFMREGKGMEVVFDSGSNHYLFNCRLERS